MGLCPKPRQGTCPLEPFDLFRYGGFTPVPEKIDGGAGGLVPRPGAWGQRPQGLSGPLALVEADDMAQVDEPLDLRGVVAALDLLDVKMNRI